MVSLFPFSSVQGPNVIIFKVSAHAEWQTARTWLKCLKFLTPPLSLLGVGANIGATTISINSQRRKISNEGKNLETNAKEICEESCEILLRLGVCAQDIGDKLLQTFSSFQRSRYSM